MKNLKKIVEKRLGKKRMELVQEIGLDSELIDVVLKDGVCNTDCDETIWVWGLHRFEDFGVTRKDMLDSLVDWFDNLEQKAI